MGFTALSLCFLQASHARLYEQLSGIRRLGAED
jgi:hypothetical protein